MNLLYVTNVDWFFISHRLPLAVEAVRRGYKVYLLTANTGHKEELMQMGINFIEIPFERSGKNPVHEFICILMLIKFYKKLKPDIIHHITLKASLLGSIAAKISGKKNVINAISGLGYNFTDGRNGILQKIIKLFIKIAYKSDSFSFIIQNPDDLRMIENMNLVPKDNFYLIKGSGIDLKEYQYIAPKNHNKLQILFPARILIDKGVREYIGAAMQLKEKYQNKVIFVLAGACDEGNLAVFSEAELQKALIPNYIKWIGFQKNMYNIYAESDIVVLPSYREGLPKSLIEACAIGRPIVTTDVPGCRECVAIEKNGYLVPVKETTALAQAIELLINDNIKRLRYGKESRAIAETEFSIENVIQKTFSIYDKITL